MTWPWGIMNYTFVDHILELEEGRRILTAKNITGTEDYLDEYYPRLGCVPNSLIIESMASTAGLLLFASTQFASLAMLVMIEEAKFTHPVQPGNQMLVEATLLALHADAARLEAMVRVAETAVAGATLVLGLFEIQTLTDLRMKAFFTSLLDRTKYWMQSDLSRKPPGK
jgi:3-hydroxyacyl-[acyl-carrier-protein] dehydratase